MRNEVCVILLAGALAAPADARSADDDDARIAAECPTKPALDPDERNNARYEKCEERRRFAPYEPNYFVYRRAHGDENATRVHYSFRYLLTEPDCMRRYRWTRVEGEEQRRKLAADTVKCLEGFDTRHEIYLVYTGEFDFYMATRESGPVINRISNPGLHVRQHFRREHGWDFDWIDVGLEHRSDGQASDPEERIADAASPNFGRTRAQVEYENGNHAYFDTISRDTNYFTAETRFGTEQSVKMYLRVKFGYFRNETTVTWGSPENQAAKMTHYDVVRFIANVGRPGRPQLQTEWTAGTKGAKTDSFNLGVVWPLTVCGATLPIYFRAHWGPLNTLSDYTRVQKSFGLGMQFIL